MTLAESATKAEAAAVRIAATLVRHHAVRPEEIVGVVAGRDDRMIAGLLGVLKAGAAYLPIPPDSPENRIRYLVKTSRCRLVVTTAEFRYCLHGLPVTTVDINLAEPAGVGFSAAAKIADFQVVLTPSTSQAGSIPQLTGPADVTLAP